jgi:hypothetical protein
VLAQLRCDFRSLFVETLTRRQQRPWSDPRQHPLNVADAVRERSSRPADAVWSARAMLPLKGVISRGDAIGFGIRMVVGNSVDRLACLWSQPRRVERGPTHGQSKVQCLLKRRADTPPWWGLDGHSSRLCAERMTTPHAVDRLQSVYNCIE